MNILILGGTVYVGRHMVEAALARGHEVTLLNRGQHNPDLFPQVEKLRGDRDSEDGLAALKGRRWDAVIDTCGYVPRVVRLSARLLADAADHYTFISSISVYQDPTPADADESAPLQTMEDETSEEIGEHYGALKALCERTVVDAFGPRALNLRPGLIVGPNDSNDRFPYWVRRVAQGGEVLAPGQPDRRVQAIDARDLADWNIRLAEQRVGGAFNAVGPDYPMTMRDLLDDCKLATGSDARFTWVDEPFLMEREVGIFSEMPYWLPEELNGMLALSNAAAMATGLRFRPLEETARDVYAWDAARQREANGHTLTLGMKRERETALLAEWHARQTSQAQA